MPMPKLPFERPDPLGTLREYAQLRAGAPVARVTTADGQPAWLVTSHDAAAAALPDPRLRATPPGAESPWDGESHLRMRRLVAKAFTPRKVEAVRPRVEQLAREQAAVFAAAGPPGDLVDGFAAPLSIGVIAELLGVAIDERDRFRTLADAASAADPFAADAGDDTAAAWEAFGGYAAELVGYKREQLGGDLLSDLIRVHDAADGRLADDELILLVTVLVASGYLTATNAIAVSALLLLAHDRLAEMTEGDVTATVEELVRLRIGLIGEPFPRYAHEDVELAGVPIAKGDRVLVRLEAANRDPAQYPDPDELLPQRPPGPRLTFGRGRTTAQAPRSPASRSPRR
ncbi:MAG: cytochrome P450 [Streptosporangiales bacterium]|nr:cytochrome P450 [Streptosporangiales bacterium]